MTIIRDGSGKNYSARVGSDLRLHTNAVINKESEHATELGQAYNINTGELTLTSDSKSAVVYIKNNETSEFHVESIAIGIDRAVGVTSGDQVKIIVERDPTGGTIVDTTPTDVDINQNRNFGSSNTLDMDVYKGGEGETLTGGSDVILLYISPSSRLFGQFNLVLPKGTKLGITVTPPANNTSMKCYVAVIGHLELEE